MSRQARGSEPARPKVGGGYINTPQASTMTPTAKPRPSVEEIRRRAYDVFLERQRTGRPGTAESDWLEAERQLRGML
jgi:hypothetical protein